MEEKITEQENYVKKLREDILRWEKEHKETLGREKEEMEARLLKLSSYQAEFMRLMKGILEREEKKLAEILASVKRCEVCSGEVELRSSTGSSLHSDSLYICKVCGHIQEEYVG